MADRDLRTRRSRLVRVVQPLQEFIATEVAGGAVLLVAAVTALVWANSPWSDRYFDLLDTHLVVDLDFYRLDGSLHFWINDAAMVLFFFLVGLEIKRELVSGELNSVRRAVVPLAAASGGMLVPAAIFLLIARGAPERAGWGVPMATDIAFALGVTALLGARVPLGLKVLLLALAIFDDIGAVAVIAIFYADEINLGPLLLAGGLLVAVYGLSRAHVRQLPVYVLLGLMAWAAAVKSGVHPTVVGVALGLLTPTRGAQDPYDSAREAEAMVEELRAGSVAIGEQAERGHLTQALLRLRRLSEQTIAPLDRLEHGLNRWVAFLVVPLFALANAGVDLRGDALGDAARSGVTWAVALGLLLGKPLGILGGSWLAVRLGGQLPEGVRWPGVLGIGLVAAIGFTVALFVAQLAYEQPTLLDEAKVGILAASLLGGVGGYLLLRRLAPARD